VQASRQRSIPEALRSKIMADRRSVLLDVELDPDRSNQVLLPALLAQVRSLMQGAAREAGMPADAHLFLEEAALLMAQGLPQRARAALLRGLAIHPADPLLSQNLAEIERGRAAGVSRGGGR